MLRDLKRYISCLPQASVIADPGNVEDRLFRSNILSDYDLRLAINGEKAGGYERHRYGRIPSLAMGLGIEQTK